MAYIKFEATFACILYSSASCSANHPSGHSELHNIFALSVCTVLGIILKPGTTNLPRGRGQPD